MRILIINQHSHNRGDEAAGRAVISSLLEALPDSDIEVCYRHNYHESRIWDDTDRVKHFTDVNLSSVSRLAVAWNLLLLVLRRRSGFLGKPGTLVRHILKADIVVNAPTGPNIGDIYRDQSYMVSLIMAILAKKPVFLYGSSVGPFRNPWVRFTARCIFERMARVCVRDEQSFKYLRELALKNKHIYCSADAALQRKIPGDYAEELYRENNIPLDKPLVGVTPLGYRWYPRTVRSPEHQLRMAQSLAKVIDALVEQGCRPVFFPQLFRCDDNGTVTADDMEVIECVRKLLKESESYVVSPSVDSDGQQSMIALLDCFVGMRYHSVVFSTKMAVPCIAVCYEHKTSAFMQAAGVGDMCVDIIDFLKSPDPVIEKLEKIRQKGDEIRYLLQDRMPEMERRAGRGTELIGEALHSSKVEGESAVRA